MFNIMSPHCNKGFFTPTPRTVGFPDEYVSYNFFARVCVKISELHFSKNIPTVGVAENL